ncbi:MAG: AsmA family protein [Candidatus Omnitrophota bacterium]|nr:AsmA family protein [Candidatus Omnitrophota bacterium]
MKKLLIGIIAALALLFLAKGVIARLAVSAGVKAVTGLRLEIRSLQVGVFRSRVHAREIKLHNPRGFPDPLMADLPELYVDYDLPAFFTGRTHLRELRVELAEFNVVKDRQGRLNLDSLTAVKKAKEEKGKEKKPVRPGSFQIDQLDLKVRKVVYKDYSGGGEPSVREFNVNLHERHANVNDPTALGALIVSRALLNTAIAKLAHFDLGALDNYAKDVVGKAVDTAGDVVEKASDTLKNLLK